MESLHQAKLAAHFRDDFARAFKIRALVRGRNHGAEASLAFGNSRETDRRREDTGVVEAAGKFESFRGLSHMDRSDRCLRHARGKSKPLQTALKKLRIRPKFLNEFFAIRRIEQRERGLTGGHYGRRMTGGIEKGPGSTIEEIYQVPRTANVSTHRANRFAERAHLDVHASMAS